MMYKQGHAKTWEKGIAVFIRAFIDGIANLICDAVTAGIKIYQWATKDDLAEHIQDTSLLLTPEEISELLKRLSGMPYELPTMDNIINSDGMLRLEISAFGLATDCTKFTPTQLEQITQRVVAGFWRTIRNYTPVFFISLASATRLIILIPLSEIGRKNLRKIVYETEARKRQMGISSPPPLEETVDIPDFSEDSTMPFEMTADTEEMMGDGKR